jgi:hypothetical protein
MQRFALVILMFALAACGSSGGSGPHTSAASIAYVAGGDPTAAQTSPCKLFTTAQLKAGLGIDVQTGALEQGALEPTCDWAPQGDGPAVLAAVKKASEANFNSDLSGPVADNYHRTAPVVGTDSVWFGTSDDQKSSISLLVLSGGYQYQMTVGNYAKIGDAATVKAKLLALAQAEF